MPKLNRMCPEMAGLKSLEELQKYSEQLNAEISSAHLYLSMAAYLDGKSLEGMAHWMKMQAQEELTHSAKFYAYINDINGSVQLDAIPKPDADYGSVKGVFEAVLKHEKHVTALIHKLVQLARNESDYATEIFLQWFVSEQVEEEANVSKLLDDLELIGDKPQGLFMLDRQLGARQAAGSSH